jgi:transposase InsO family protein
MCRHDGHRVWQATVLRLLRDENAASGQLPAWTPAARRRRRAAFATEPTGPNQVWQLDFSEFETASGGTWRLSGYRGYWSKYEFGWHISPTDNQHDAIGAIELAVKEAEALAGQPFAEPAPRDAEGRVQPLVTVVTDNGGPFRSFRFEAFIATRPQLRHVRARVRTPGQNGSRERGFDSLKYEKLFLEEIPDALDLVRQAEDYRHDYNTVRPHEALAWNRTNDVHTGTADPLIPNFPEPENLPILDAGHLTAEQLRHASVHCGLNRRGPIGGDGWAVAVEGFGTVPPRDSD